MTHAIMTERHCNHKCNTRIPLKIITVFIKTKEFRKFLLKAKQLKFLLFLNLRLRNTTFQWLNVNQ